MGNQTEEKQLLDQVQTEDRYSFEDIKILYFLSPTLKNILDGMNEQEQTDFSSYLSYLVYYSQKGEVFARDFSYRTEDKIVQQLLSYYGDDADKSKILNEIKRNIHNYAKVSTPPTMGGSLVDNIEKDIFENIDYSKLRKASEIIIVNDDIMKSQGLKASIYSF